MATGERYDASDPCEAKQARGSKQRARRRETNAAEFEDETLLPSQYLDRIVADPSLQPEKRLMLAVLENAVAAYQKYALASSRRARRLFGEAAAWLTGPADAGMFSFNGICDALELDPEFVRAGLERWRRRQRGLPASRYPFRRVSGSRHKVEARRRRGAGGGEAGRMPGWAVAARTTPSVS
jgi:hypothetical protein